ncbi:MAG: hypothetical protein Q8P07_01205 [bacterium]|nr:hypothetical protein [bacterium]
MQEDIRKIIGFGILAPSGGNSQPWRFEVKDNVISAIALPDLDHKVLNFRHRGTLVAHGACMENMLIASSQMGYKTDFREFPDASNPNLTFILQLQKAASTTEPLFHTIEKRVTNRKAYETTPLTEKQRAEFLKLDGAIGGVRLKLIEKTDEIKVLGRASADNERVMLENKILHSLFFKELVWTEEEEKIKRSGLYLKTMEMEKPKEKALSIFKYWPLMAFANKFGMASRIASDNAAIYSSSGAMIIIMAEDTDLSFFRSGRLLEKVWLTAEYFGLSVNLMTGVPFLHQNVKGGNKDIFSKKELSIITNAYKNMDKLAGTENKYIIMGICRIGSDGNPSARSSKKNADIKFL